MKFNRILLSALALLISTGAYASYPSFTTLDRESLKATAQDIHLLSGAPGVVFGFVSLDETFTFGFGETEKGNKTVPDEHTEWQIGSVSKMLTARILASFDEKGLIRLNDPISKFLPEKIQMPTFHGQPITFLHLATHTSGLPRLPDYFTKDPKKFPDNDPFVNFNSEDFYNWLHSFSLPYAPGVHYEYSNAGFGLLGDLLARANHSTFNELIQTYLSKPYGLTDTTTQLSSEQLKRKATSYSIEGQPLTDWKFQQIQAGSGGIYSSVHDLVKLVQANISTTDPHEMAINRINHSMYIYHSDLENHASFLQDGMALGFDVKTDKFGSPTILSKNGMVAGFCTYVAMMPSEHLGLVVITNRPFFFIDKTGDEMLIMMWQAKKKALEKHA